MQENQETPQQETPQKKRSNKTKNTKSPVKMLDPKEDPQVLSDNFTKIIPVDVLKETKTLYWGGNGVGDRWGKKKYNYAFVFSKKTLVYSENDDDVIPPEILQDFQEKNKGMGIIGVFVFSKKHEKNQNSGHYGPRLA